MSKCVVIGVTGSIAAYKACDIASRLKKAGVDVHVILTRAGAQFITPLALETVSANPVVTDMFSRETPWEVEHIALAKKADVFLVAPASADILAKAAYGIADDMLSTTLLAVKTKIIAAPAMNSAMYLNPIVQDNIAVLKARGWEFIEPDSGMLACGDTGIGKLAPADDIAERVINALNVKRDLAGKRILVTAGPTQERIDPVRYLTNRSTGKMGYCIAEAALDRGADVTLVSGPVHIDPPKGAKLVKVSSSADMCEAVQTEFTVCDALVMAAAPADFTPRKAEDNKIKKNGREGMQLSLVCTQDILELVGADKGERRLMGFAAETQELEKNAAVKLEKKNLDMIAANDVTAQGVGFAGDTNAVTLYYRDGTNEKSGLVSKRMLADWLLDRLF